MLALLLHARDAIVMRPHYAVAYARGYTTASGHDRAAMARDLVVRRSRLMLAAPFSRPADRNAVAVMRHSTAVGAWH